MASKSQTLGMTLYTVEGDPYVTMTTHVNNTYANFQIIDTFASKANTDIETYGTRLVTLTNTVSALSNKLESVSDKTDKNTKDLGTLTGTVSALSNKLDSVSDKTDKNTEDLSSLGLTVVDGLLCVNINS